MIREGKETDMAAILTIYNDAILNTTAVFTYEPFSSDYAQSWYDDKVTGHWPLLVDEEDGSVAGFATFGTFRDWPAYKYTIEHSIYVHPDFRNRGIATRLMKQLIAIADERHYATIVAGINSENEGSIVLHNKLGFRKVGEIKRAGYKFGHWLDLSFYQLDLEGPACPVGKE
jgi:phosphinothricin acetyltransferase